METSTSVDKKVDDLLFLEVNVMSFQIKLLHRCVRDNIYMLLWIK
jgi:hypothetical protein